MQRDALGVRKSIKKYAVRGFVFKSNVSMSVGIRYIGRSLRFMLSLLCLAINETHFQLLHFIFLAQSIESQIHNFNMNSS